MKKVLIPIFLITLLLGACAPKPTVPPSENPRQLDLHTSAPETKSIAPKIEIKVVGNAPAQDSHGTDASVQDSKNTAASVRFVVSGDSRGADTGVHEKEMGAILEQIKRLDPQPAFMVVLGDLVQGDKDAKKLAEQYRVWKALATKYYPLNFYYPLIGNHEMILQDKRGLDVFDAAFDEFKPDVFYGNGYGRSVYYFDRGNARFFVVNAYHPDNRHSIAPDVVEWMQQNTDESKAFHFVFAHAPAWPAGAHYGSSLDTFPEKRDVFWQAVDAMPGAIFFAGHEHNYSRTAIDSSFSETVGNTHYSYKNTVQQVVVGGFGAPLQTGLKTHKGIMVAPKSVYCYAVVDIFEDRVSVHAYDVQGELLDAFEVKK